jgi:hypothetical protein
MADNVLKPLMLGRGVDAPMPVILIGALGGMATDRHPRHVHRRRACWRWATRSSCAGSLTTRNGAATGRCRFLLHHRLSRCGVLRRRPAAPSFLAAALLLGGCAAVGPDFKRPEVPWLADWSGGSLTTLAAEKRGSPRPQTEEWWRNFDDPVLDALVAEAQRANPNVRTAGMRIMEARAQLAIAGSLLYPQQQQVTGKVLRTGTEASSGPDSALTAYNIGFGVGWEIDFWGKFRRSIEAADAATSPASPSTTTCRC